MGPFGDLVPRPEDAILARVRRVLEEHGGTLRTPKEADGAWEWSKGCIIRHENLWELLNVVERRPQS